MRALQFLANLRRWAYFTSLTAIFATCATPTPGASFTIADLPRAPQAWLDQPLDGTQFPLGEAITVEAHARDATGPGITEMQLFVDGSMTDSQSTNASEPLAHAVMVWTPTAPGEYLVEVKAVSQTGTISEPASARVIISGTPTPTSTPTHVTNTPTVTPTRTGTAIPPRVVTTTVPPPRPIPVTTTVAPRIIPTTLTPTRTATVPIPPQARRVNGSFSASTTFLSTPGSSVTFNWSTQASSSFTYSLVLEMRAQSGGFLQTNMATNVTQHTSSTVAFPTVTTTYTLRAYYNTASEQATSQEIGSVTVTVQGTPTATITIPPPPAAASISGPFANPTTINQGQCSTLSWNAQNVRDVFLYGGELGGEPGQGMPGQGSRQVCPSATTTYTLRVNTQSSGYVYRAVTVTVNAPAPAANRNPNVPSNVSPATNTGFAVGTAPRLCGQHNGDPDGDAITDYFFLVSGAKSWESGWVTTSCVDIPASAVNSVGTYYWLVRVRDARGGVTASNTWYFVIQSAPSSGPATPPPPTGITATRTGATPCPNVYNCSQYRVTISWNPSPGATRYQVWAPQCVTSGETILPGTTFSGTVSTTSVSFDTVKCSYANGRTITVNPGMGTEWYPAATIPWPWSD